MRIGLGIMSGSSNAQAVESVRRAADEGFAAAWFSNIFGLDALTAAAVAGAQVDGIDIGTFVVPIYTRHPMTMAQQAVSVSDACSGRFTLGVGLSHQVVIETMMGIAWVKPASTMREYLSVMMPLIREGKVSFLGDTYRVNTMLELPEGFSPPPVIVAALGPVMLEMAGTLADGTATWMTGPRTLATHTVPTITEAAQAAGRPAPRIVAGLPVCVSSDTERAREKAGSVFSVYGTLPSYRAMLDREGAAGPSEVALVGNRDEIAGTLGALGASGVTDFVAAPYGTPDEIEVTRRLMVELNDSQ